MGDEGKGFTTQQFCNKFKSQGLNPIVVCYNGGSQRSHTCVYNGFRHAFRHFGSGTLVGCPTYLSEEFILNPIIFRQEYEELVQNGVKLNGKVFVNTNCRITTPFEMFLNDMKERKRNKNRHGSCGFGIYETVSRKIQFNISDCMGEWDSAEILNIHRDFNETVIEENLSSYLMDYMKGDTLTNVLKHYIEDLIFMLKHTSIINTEKEFLESYDAIVFEGGQGLKLDQSNKKDFPHLTPSNTGSTNPIKILEGLDLHDAKIEVCYVTRSYLTRHGAGELENECLKEDINPNMFDKTNVPNPYQGTLRYGKLDALTLSDRIYKDFRLWYGQKLNFSSIRRTLMITHQNEHHIDIIDIVLCGDRFDKFYLSYDETTQVI